MYMRKYYWFFGVFLGLISCDVDYQDNKRLLITGTVVDENQEPVSNVPVAVYVSFSRGFGGDTRELLGESRTGADGIFSLVTLAPLGNLTITADINERFQQGFRQQYATFSLIGIETMEIEDSSIKLRNLRLERLINTSFTLKRLTNTTDTIYYGLRTNPIEKRRFVDASLAPDVFPNFFRPLDSLFPSQNEVSLELRGILAKDTVQLEYRLSSNPNAEVVSQKLVYNPETDSYVFEL
jgi:hypothetical protein